MTGLRPDEVLKAPANSAALNLNGNPLIASFTGMPNGQELASALSLPPSRKLVKAKKVVKPVNQPVPTVNDLFTQQHGISYSDAIRSMAGTPTARKIGEFLSTPTNAPGEAVSNAFGNGPIAAGLGVTVNAVPNALQTAASPALNLIDLPFALSGNSLTGGGISGRVSKQLGQHLLDSGFAANNPTTAAVLSVAPEVASFAMNGTASGITMLKHLRHPIKAFTSTSKANLLGDLKAAGRDVKFTLKNPGTAFTHTRKNLPNFRKPIVPAAEDLSKMPSAFDNAEILAQNEQFAKNLRPVPKVLDRNGLPIKPAEADSVAGNTSSVARRIRVLASKATGRDQPIMQIPRMGDVSNLVSKTNELLKNPDNIYESFRAKQVEDIVPAVLAASYHGLEIPKGLAPEVQRIVDRVHVDGLPVHARIGEAVDTGLSVTSNAINAVPVGQTAGLDANAVLQQERNILARSKHGAIYASEANAVRYATDKLGDIPHTIEPLANGKVIVRVEGQPDLPVFNGDKIEVAKELLAKDSENVAREGAKAPGSSAKISGKGKAAEKLKTPQKPNKTRQESLAPKLVKGKKSNVVSRTTVIAKVLANEKKIPAIVERANKLDHDPMPEKKFADGTIENSSKEVAFVYDESLAEAKRLGKIEKTGKWTILDTPQSLLQVRKKVDAAGLSLAWRLGKEPKAAVSELLSEVERGFINPYLLAHLTGALIGAAVGGTFTDKGGEFNISAALAGAVLGALAPAVFKLFTKPIVEKGSFVITAKGDGVVITDAGKAVKVKLRSRSAEGKVQYVNAKKDDVYLQGEHIGDIENRSFQIGNPDVEEALKHHVDITETVGRKFGPSARARSLMHKMQQFGKRNLTGRDYLLRKFPVVRESMEAFRTEAEVGQTYYNELADNLFKTVGEKNLRTGTFSRYMMQKDVLAQARAGKVRMYDTGTVLDPADLEKQIVKWEQSLGEDTLARLKAGEVYFRAAYDKMFNDRVALGIVDPASKLDDYFPRIMEKYVDGRITFMAGKKNFVHGKGTDILHRGQATFEFERGSIQIPFYENDVLKVSEDYMTRHYADIAKIRLFKDLIANENYTKIIARLPDGSWPDAPKVVNGQPVVEFTGSDLLKHLHIDSFLFPEHGMEELIDLNKYTGKQFKIYMNQNLNAAMAEHFDNFVPHPIGQAFRTVTGIWKLGVLHPYAVGLGYDITNALGDAERLALFAPEAFDKLSAAFRISKYMREKPLTTEEILNTNIGPLKSLEELPTVNSKMTEPEMRKLAVYLERNGISSGGFQNAEIGKDAGSSSLRHTLSLQSTGNKLGAAAETIMLQKTVTKLRGIREDTARIAVAMKFLEYAQNGSSKMETTLNRLAPVGKDAKREYFKYISGLKQAGRVDLIIAKAARDTMVDYGDFSHFEQRYLRSMFIPFYSFMKANAVGLTRIAVNDPLQFSKHVAAIYGASAFWNYSMFPEQEKLLRPYEQARPHIWVPRPFSKDGENPFVAVGYSSIYADFFENIMMMNGAHTIESAITDDPATAIENHVTEAYSGLLKKSSFAISPVLSIPRLAAPILGSISHGKAPSTEQWKAFANNLTANVLPGGRFYSKVFDQTIDGNTADLGLNSLLKLDRFVDSPHTPAELQR